MKTPGPHEHHCSTVRLTEATSGRRGFVLGLGSLALTGCGGGGGGDANTGKNTPPVVQPATPTVWVVQTLAGNSVCSHGDGTGTISWFKKPSGLDVGPDDHVYVADSENHRIRKIDPNGVVTTLAGTGDIGHQDGTGNTATFNYPTDVAVDSDGNVFVADYSNMCVRKITPAGLVSTFAGSGQFFVSNAMGSITSLTSLSYIAVDLSNNLYVVDNSVIRKITPSAVVSTLAGSAGSYGSADGTGTAATFNSPQGLAVDQSGQIYVADSYNNRIRKITSNGVVSTLAGSGRKGTADGIGSLAEFNNPIGLDVDASGMVFVSDDNHCIRQITPQGVVSTVAGFPTLVGNYRDGTGSLALFNYPTDIAIDSSGQLYVADKSICRIRKIIHIP